MSETTTEEHLNGPECPSKYDRTRNALLMPRWNEVAQAAANMMGAVKCHWKIGERPRLKPGSRARQNLEPDPEPDCRVGPTKPGSPVGSRAWARPAQHYSTFCQLEIPVASLPIVNPLEPPLGDDDLKRCGEAKAQLWILDSHHATRVKSGNAEPPSIICIHTTQNLRRTFRGSVEAELPLTNTCLFWGYCGQDPEIKPIDFYCALLTAALPLVTDSVLMHQAHRCKGYKELEGKVADSLCGEWPNITDNKNGQGDLNGR
ncbi:hypothetical protein B0H10DRAFT_2196828 [Mycena sp. CBHHK59/15]|nr:hypothetical protein B0H10DRAFT_2196828 [Mycena sp. CBHHK59/15]